MTDIKAAYQKALARHRKIDRITNRVWDRLAKCSPGSNRCQYLTRKYDALVESRYTAQRRLERLTQLDTRRSRRAIKERGGLDFITLVENIERDRREGRSTRRRRK